jgi:TonB family protein
MKSTVVLLLGAVLLVATAGAADSLAVPKVTGLSMYRAYRVLKKLGLVSRFDKVELDTAKVPLFFVAGQAPDSGAAAKPGDTVLVRFNHPGMLVCWNPAFAPMLGDFDNLVSFYKVQKPPEPIKAEPAGYPDELRKYVFSGDAEVEALVDFDGGVLAARVVKSSGHVEADSAACDAALRASFSPAEDRGQPVRVWFPLPYHWQFKEDKAAPGAESKTVKAPGEE